jgi:hypothetical protein
VGEKLVLALERKMKFQMIIEPLKFIRYTLKYLQSCRLGVAKGPHHFAGSGSEHPSGKQIMFILFL